MNISIIIILISMVVGIVGVFAWVIITKDDSEENIKKCSKYFNSIVFYGVVFILLSLTLYNHLN